MPAVNGESAKRARCPTCRKTFPVVESQIGCCIECPYCHAAFRLFETDLVKRKHLVAHARRAHRRRDTLLVGIMMVLAVVVLALLYWVWKRSIELAAMQPEPSSPVEEPAWMTVAREEPARTSQVVRTETVESESTAKTTPELEEGAQQKAEQPSSVVLAVQQVGLAGPAIPVYERGEKVADLPFTIYADCVGAMPYTPSGYMGNFEDMDFDDCCETKPQSGDSCIEIAYRSRYQWVGVAWQDPPNNWGDIPGGYDLSRASKLTFWARGKTGAERAEFKMGLIGRTKKYADSARITTGKVQLSKDWRKYEMPLQGLDLSRIITAFAVVLEGAPAPTVIYIDNVCFE